MAYTARLVGRDVTLLEFDGVSVLATYRRADIRLTVDTVDTTAVMDSGRDFRPVHYTWTISFEGLKESGNTSWLEKVRDSSFEDVSFEMVIDGKTITGWCTTVTSPIHLGRKLRPTRLRSRAAAKSTSTALHSKSGRTRLPTRPSRRLAREGDTDG